jgi:hypothetical protein
MNRYGYTEKAWETAKREGISVLSAYAKRRQMVPYSEFVAHIQAVQFEGPHDPRLWHLLGEISEVESEAGRGMLSALVVHKGGDFQPGPGFFELAEKLGHDTSDIEKFWVQEVKRVFAAWAK